MNRAQACGRRAFALTELVAIVLIGILVAALLLVGGSRSRRLANLGQDINRLHEIAAATGQYGADFQDHIWSFSWRAGVHYNSPWPELNDATTDLEAQRHQAMEILRRRTGRPIPDPGNWLPHVKYSHLVLADYLEAPFPWLPVVSTGDAVRVLWVSDPACYFSHCFTPCQPPDFYDSGYDRYLYAGSFGEVPAAWDRSPVGRRVEQGPSNSSYLVGGIPLLGPGVLTDVAYPHDKVHVMDEFARHFGFETQVFFTHTEAKLPLLFFDGRAQLKQTRDANPGWRPNSPQDPQPTIMQAFIRTGRCTPGVGNTYQDSPAVPSPGVFRWTRSGLLGRDFGPEVWSAEPERNGRPTATERNVSAAE